MKPGPKPLHCGHPECTRCHDLRQWAKCCPRPKEDQRRRQRAWSAAYKYERVLKHGIRRLQASKKAKLQLIEQLTQELEALRDVT